MTTFITAKHSAKTKIIVLYSWMIDFCFELYFWTVKRIPFRDKYGPNDFKLSTPKGLFYNMLGDGGSLKKVNHQDYELDLSKPLGNDGSGKVDPVKNKPNLVAKIYTVCDGLPTKRSMQREIEILQVLSHPNLKK